MSQPKHVEHLIIGAGLAGLVLRHHLSSDEVVIVDPNPAAYKIGESLIPELFRPPELAALLPRICALPSYTPKYGTTFVANSEVAYFPIGRGEARGAMHILRSELEQAMIDAWGIDVVPARVEAIDFESKQVHTSAGTYAVEGLILDCSGPAMVVANMLGEVEQLLPIHATWAYYDVVEERPAAFEQTLRERGWSYLQFDVRHRRVVPEAEADVAEIARGTYLSQVGEGIWTWQIPLYGGTRLSYGVVSRHGPISVEAYREIAESNAAPHFRLARRPEGGPSPLDRVHRRDGFARRAKRPADRDFILLADAFGFSDPVYSVGAGYAVSQAIEVATLLEREAWSPRTCEAYVRRCKATLDRAVRAFEFWYSGDVIRDSEAANEVQYDFLLGGLFQSGISEHYGAAIEGASPASERDPFEATWEDAELGEPVAELLGLDGERSLAGWALLAALPCAGGIQLRWSGHELPELTMLVAHDEDGEQPCFRRLGPLALSYMQLFDRAYPQTPALEALFDAVAERLRGKEQGWLALDPATARLRRDHSPPAG